MTNMFLNWIYVVQTTVDIIQGVVPMNPHALKYDAIQLVHLGVKLVYDRPHFQMRFQKFRHQNHRKRLQLYQDDVSTTLSIFV